MCFFRKSCLIQEKSGKSGKGRSPGSLPGRRPPLPGRMCLWAGSAPAGSVKPWQQVSCRRRQSRSAPPRWLRAGIWRAEHGPLRSVARDGVQLRASGANLANVRVSNCYFLQGVMENNTIAARLRCRCGALCPPHNLTGCLDAVPTAKAERPHDLVDRLDAMPSAQRTAEKHCEGTGTGARWRMQSIRFP